MDKNFTKDIEDFKDLCERIFSCYTPLVDKGEARAGVLGHHPLALLVIALDYIDDTQAENEQKATEIVRLETVRRRQAKENERLKEKIKQLEQDVKTAYGAFLK